MLRSFIAASLFILAALGIAAYVYNLPYWALPPHEKFATEWRQDLKLLEKSGHFPKEWQNLADVEFTSNDTQVQDWYKKTGIPFTTKKDGANKLQILGVHYIDGYRYGVLLQYVVIDAKSGNKTHELARTLKLGIIY